MKTIHLIRHCRSVGQEPKARLTPAGVEQARKLAAFLAGRGIDHVVSSPFARAVSSITPFAKDEGLGLTLDARLEERILSAEYHPDWQAMLERSFADHDLAFARGESARAAAKWGLAVFDEILAGPDSNAAVVTHGNLMALLLGNFDGGFGFEQWKALSNPDVYLLTFAASGKPGIARVWNDA